MSKYVACAVNPVAGLSSYIVNSDDGINWVYSDVDNIFGIINNDKVTIQKIGFINNNTDPNNKKYVGVGSIGTNPLITYSENGLDWNISPINLNNSVITTFDSGTIGDVNKTIRLTIGGLYLTGKSFIAYSDDAENWFESRKASKLFDHGFINFLQFFSISDTCNFFVATGSNGNGGVFAWTKPFNGGVYDWFQVSPDLFPNGIINCFETNTDGTTFVVGGYDRTIESSDLIGYIAYATNNDIDQWYISESSKKFTNGINGICCIKYSSKFKWFAGGSDVNNGVIIQSQDGINWSDPIIIFNGYRGNVISISITNDQIVCVGTKINSSGSYECGISSSTDGVNWTLQSGEDIGTMSSFLSISSSSLPTSNIYSKL